MDATQSSGPGLSQQEAEDKLHAFGYNEVTETRTSVVGLFLKHFWGLSAWILEIIALLSFFLHRTSDTIIVLSLLVINAVVSFAQQQNAAKAVDMLKLKLQITARVLRDSSWTTIPARQLVPGDVVRIRKGDFVPADIRIIEGDVRVDQSALTGESADVEKHPNESIYSGSVITFGETTATITATGKNTFFGKTIELVKSAQPKSHIETVISSVVRWLLAIVGVSIVISLVASYFQQFSLVEVLPLMLVLLLGAVPVALSVMFTVSMAVGSRQLARQGALVTRLNATEDAACMDILCVDKTGTLTLNKLSVAALTPAKGYSSDDLLMFGALASEDANIDPVDVAFLQAARERNVLNTSAIQENFIPFDPATRRTEAFVKIENQHLRVLKGAFRTLAQISKATETDVRMWEGIINEWAGRGYRIIGVAKGMKEMTPDFVGLVALQDTPRSDSKRIVQELHDLGVSVKMLTGDSKPVAVETARAVSLGNSIATRADLKDGAALAGLLMKISGVSDVFPEDKFKIIKALQSSGHVIGMTGDGVNDAPALKQAEVGIAVSNATDVAKSAASIILTTEGLSGIIAPIKVGRMIFERVNIWILNKLARTVLKTCFIVVSFLILGKFVITATAMLVMIFMTDFAKISLSTDHVHIEPYPAKWRIKDQVVIGTALGLLMTLETLALLFFGISYFQLTDPPIQTYSFELLLFFALSSILVVREKRFFWSSWPSAALALILSADLLLGIAICTFGLFGFSAIPLRETMFLITSTWVLSLFVNDRIKRLLMRKILKWRQQTVPDSGKKMESANNDTT